MTYTKEDYNFIKSWLDKCVKIEKDNGIYYVTSPNIIRQLKYNQLLKNKKEIKTDLTKMTFKDNCILHQDLKNKYFWVNYYKTWSIFETKYGDNYLKNSELINDILSDILNLNEYTTGGFAAFGGTGLSDILNLNEYTTWKGW